MRYFYTYGTDPESNAFVGGWTEVHADSRTDADRAYTKEHPRRNGVLPCAFVYDENRFTHTKMFDRGNFGERAHEVIHA